MAKKRNRQFEVTKRRHKLMAFQEGVSIKIYYRTYKDKFGKKRTVIAGPGLREAKSP